MTAAELAVELCSVVPQLGAVAAPRNPSTAAFAVAQTVSLVRDLQPDLVIPLCQDDGGNFGREVGMGAPATEPLLLRRNENGCLRILPGVLEICRRAERVVLVGEVLQDGREAAEFITLLGLGERAVGVVTLWDKRQLEWPTIAGVPVHALFRGQSPEIRSALTKTQALRAWASLKIA